MNTYPLFRSTVHHSKGKVWGDTLYWQTPPASACDPAHHTVYKTLPVASSPDPPLSEGNDNECDVALRGYVEPLLGSFFDLGRGMFAVHVVEYEVVGGGGKVEGRVDLVWRLHHGLGDGVVLSKCLEELCEADEAGAEKPKKDEKKTNPLYFAWLSLKAVGKILALPLSCSDAQTNLKAPMDWRKVSHEKSYSPSLTMSLPLVRSESKKRNCTINDLLTALLTRGIRRHLLLASPGVAPPSSIRCLAVVNTRRDADMSAFRAGKGANEFSYVIPRLPTGHETFPPCLEAVKRDMDALKSGPEAFVVREANNLVRNMVGGSFVMKFNCDYVVNKLTLFFSNLAGPREAVKLAGARVLRMYNWVEPMMYGIGVSVMSYNGEVTFVVSGDKERTEGVRRGIDEEWRELVAETESGMY